MPVGDLVKNTPRSVHGEAGSQAHGLWRVWLAFLQLCRETRGWFQGDALCGLMIMGPLVWCVWGGVDAECGREGGSVAFTKSLQSGKLYLSQGGGGPDSFILCQHRGINQPFCE